MIHRENFYANLKKYSDQLNKDYNKLMRDDFNEEKWVSDGKKIDDNMKKFERDKNKNIEFITISWKF